MPRQLAARGPTITTHEVLEVTHQSVSPTHHPTVNNFFEPTHPESKIRSHVLSGENFPKGDSGVQGSRIN